MDPLTCGGWEQESRKYVILETNGSFTSALSERLFGVGVGLERPGPPHPHRALSLLQKPEMLRLCILHSLFPGLPVPFVTKSQAARVGRGPKATSALLGQRWCPTEARLQSCLSPRVISPSLSDSVLSH